MFLIGPQEVHKVQEAGVSSRQESLKRIVEPLCRFGVRAGEITEQGFPAESGEWEVRWLFGRPLSRRPSWPSSIEEHLSDPHCLSFTNKDIISTLSFCNQTFYS